MPSANAGSAVTLLGGLADLGQSAPFSGQLALSSDGRYVTFAAYEAAAGTFVGTSSNVYSATGLGPQAQTQVSAALPPASKRAENVAGRKEPG